MLCPLRLRRVAGSANPGFAAGPRGRPPKSESLANVAKYARASGARVALSRCNGTLRVEIVDDGVGGADASQGSGLRGLEDRVSAVRGSFRVETRATGGTRVLAEIPCDTRNRPADGDPAATPGAAAPDY